MATTTGATKNTSKSQKQKQKSPVVQVVARPSQPPVQHQREGQTLRMHQKELVVRLSGLEKVWAIPLAPGKTGAKRLDELARQHGWFRWQSSPKISFRSLSSNETAGTYSYLVVHDAELATVMEGRYWDTASRQYTSNKATVSFTHTIALESLINRQLSNTSTRCTWFLIKYDGPETAPGELWLEWDVAFGGIAESGPPPVTFHVKAGRFYPIGSDKPLDGFPVFGPNSSYTFGANAPSRQQIADLLDDMGAKPLQVVRPVESGPIADDRSTVREISFVIPDSWSQRVDQFVSSAVRSAGYRVLKSLRGLVGLGGKTLLPGKTFESYEGTVTLRNVTAPSAEYDNQPTVPPVPPFTLQEGAPDTDTGRSLAQYSRSNRSLGPLIAEALTSLCISALEPMAAAVYQAIKQSLARPNIVHRGFHAVQFFRDYSKIPVVENPGGNGPGEGDNILPEIPDFGGEPEAPGTIVEWSAAQRHFTGYVVDDNGKPIVHYLTATRVGVDYFTALTPRYYSNVRRPWDSESKRLMALQVKVSEMLKGHFLLMEAYNWGDDACGSWLNNFEGGTYVGTVARFSGVTESRSVIRVDDPVKWNQAAVHLVLGQAKDKYRSSDRGRACMFHVRIGAVGTQEIANNYLGCWLLDRSVTRLKNHPYGKGGAEATYMITTHRDFTPRMRMSSDPNLDPASPGFINNYNSVVKGSKALPIPLEAGPFRHMMLARYDDSNGWYQDVPDCAWTDTDVASNWTMAMRLNGRGSKPTNASRTAYDCVEFRVPPSHAPNAFLCIEMVGLGGTEHSTAEDLLIDTTSGAVSKGSCMFNGPVTIWRYIYQLKSSSDTIVVRSVGDTSRPTTAVDGYSGDIYVCYQMKAYLVKDEKVARNWCVGEDTEPEGEPSEFNYWSKTYYKVNPTSSDEPWALDSTKVTPPNFYTTRADVPSCGGSNTAWNASGYQMATRSVREARRDADSAPSPPPELGQPEGASDLPAAVPTPVDPAE